MSKNCPSCIHEQSTFLGRFPEHESSTSTSKNKTQQGRHFGLNQIVVFNVTVFWHNANYGLLEIDRRFRGAHCLHRQGSDQLTCWFPWPRDNHTPDLKLVHLPGPADQDYVLVTNFRNVFLITQVMNKVQQEKSFKQSFCSLEIECAVGKKLIWSFFASNIQNCYINSVIKFINFGAENRKKDAI